MKTKHLDLLSNLFFVIGAVVYIAALFFSPDRNVLFPYFMAGVFLFLSASSGRAASNQLKAEIKSLKTTIPFLIARGNRLIKFITLICALSLTAHETDK